MILFHLLIVMALSAGSFVTNALCIGYKKKRACLGLVKMVGERISIIHRKNELPLNTFISYKINRLFLSSNETYMQTYLSYLDTHVGM